MSNVQPFYTPKFRAFDSNGNPLAGGLLYSYSAGTSTPLATYTTRAGNVANANPVVLDANGEADVWVTPNVSYKFTLKNSAGVTQWTVDNVPSLPDLSLTPLQLGDGTVGAPSLSFISDTDTGLYRAGTKQPGMSAGGVQVQTWAPTGPTFPLGIVVSQSQSAAPGIQSTGNGVGAGVQGTGSTSDGTGVKGIGGATNGIGVKGQGTGTGTGVQGTGGSPNSDGVTGIGTGTGVGVTGTGGGTNAAGLSGTGGATNGDGVKGQGTGTGAGGNFTGGASNGNGAVGTGVGTGNGIQGTPSNSSSSSSGVYGLTTSSSKGVYGQSTGSGAAVSALASTSSGDAVVGTNTGSGIAGNFAGSGTGYGVQAGGNATKSALRLVPQSAPSSASIGDLYADSAGILYICTNGTGPVWTKVGTQT